MRVPPLRDDGLQIDEKRSFQRSFWRAERCAWAAFALVLLLALAGLTGADGYFATARASLAAGEVTYPRIARWEVSEEMTVTFVAGEETHRLALQPVFFEHFQVEGIQPQPERSRTTPEGVVLDFSASPDAPTKVVFYLRALRPGLLQHSATLDGTASDMSTIILP